MQLIKYKNMEPEKHVFLKAMARNFEMSHGFKIKEIGQFTVLFPGWECDSEGYIIIDTDNVRHLMMSNHGIWYEAQAEDIIERISYYKSIIEESTQVLETLEG